MERFEMSDLTVLVECFLAYQDQRSNKGYVSRILKDGETYTHATAWGGVGKSFQTAEKGGLTDKEAMKSHEKVVDEKIRKGYQPCGPEFLGYRSEAAGGVQPVVSREIEWVPMLFDPMGRDELDYYLTCSGPGGFFAQPKMNGERRRLRVEGGQAFGYNRKGQQVPVPQVLVEALVELEQRWQRPLDFDGEVIGNNQFHAFDWLEDPGVVARERIVWLEEILAKDRPLPLVRVESAFSTEAKTALYEEIMAAGGEGLVFKREGAAYFKGRSIADRKFKLWKTVTVVLTGVSATDQLQYGSFEMSAVTAGGRVVVGSVAGGFSQAERADLGLRVSAGERPAVEVRYLYYDIAALYQPTFLHERTDLRPDELVTETVQGRDGRKVQL